MTIWVDTVLSDGDGADDWKMMSRFGLPAVVFAFVGALLLGCGIIQL